MKSKVPKWDSLRVIGKSKIVSLTILVPFVGYLILFNNELVGYFELSKSLLNIPEGPNSVSKETISRLYYLYFGLTFVGLSSIAFSCFCPPVVKTSSTENEFCEREIKIMTRPRFSSWVSPFEELLLKGSDEYKELEGHVSEYINSFSNAEKRVPNEGYGRIVEKSKELEAASSIDMLGFVWSYYVSSNLLWRVIVSLGYLIGFALVMIPSAQVFIKICEIILSR